MDNSENPWVRTWQQIWRSIIKSRLRRSRKKQREIACWIRVSVGRRDWRTANPKDFASHELALAIVLVLQDFLQWTAGNWPRFRQCPYVPPEEVDPADQPVNQLDSSDPLYGYTGATGTTNGGIAGYWPTREESTEDDEKANPYGVSAFSEVAGVGHPLLAWYYSASGFELGLISNFDGQVQAALAGGAQDSSDLTSTMGPSQRVIDAAIQQRRVREALSQLTAQQRCILEIAYTDTRHPTEDVSSYGHGAALLVARAQGAQRDLRQNVHGAAALDAAKALQRGMSAIDAAAHRGMARGLAAVSGGDPDDITARLPKIRGWEPLSKVAAELLLADAHAAFIAASGADPIPTKRAQRRRKEARLADLVDVARLSGVRPLQVVQVVRTGEAA